MYQPGLPFNASVSDIEIREIREIRGLQTRKLELDRPLARIIHESVGRNEQTLSLPERPSLFSNHSEDRVRFRSMAFALFRQHVSSDNGHHHESPCRNCAALVPAYMNNSG